MEITIVYDTLIYMRSTTITMYKLFNEIWNFTAIQLKATDVALVQNTSVCRIVIKFAILKNEGVSFCWSGHTNNVFAWVVELAIFKLQIIIISIFEIDEMVILKTATIKFYTDKFTGFAISCLNRHFKLDYRLNTISSFNCYVLSNFSVVIIICFGINIRTSISQNNNITIAGSWGSDCGMNNVRSAWTDFDLFGISEKWEH